MTEREFMNRVGKNKFDFLQAVFDTLRKNKTKFCVIGGLAVNAYCEPVVSLDLDIVVASDKLDKFLVELKKKFTVRKFPNSINVSAKGSNFRIQIQTDSRYFSFIEKSVKKDVLGYKMPVACIENVLKGKIWSAMDDDRRPSKRQKDLSDIMRLIEAKPGLISFVPENLKKRLGL